MLMLKIAFRNIFRQKRRTILTTLTMLGGFALAALSIAWSDGTYSDVINIFTCNRLGHIQIHREGYLERRSMYKTIDNFESIAGKLSATEDVESFAPRIYTAGLASVGEKTSAVQIIGIDPRYEESATGFSKKIIDGKTFSLFPASEAVIGEGLAVRLKAAVGDELVIVSQAADGSIANDLYTIAGVAASGDRIADQASLYLHLRDAQELLVLYGRLHEICIIATDLRAVAPAAEEIKAALADRDLSVETWKEFARPFYVAMKADQQGSWILLFFIALVVAVGVLNTVLMTVLERRREYGVLRAIGTSPPRIFRLVILEVLVMAVIGIGVGFILSYAAVYYLSLDGIPMPFKLTYGGVEFTRMTTEINARSFYIPAVTVFLAALAVSFFPARRAARVAPARAMRTH